MLLLFLRFMRRCVQQVLQTVFDKLGIEQAIPVDRLVKGKPLDNTEFLQVCRAIKARDGMNAFPVSFLY